MRRPRFFHKVRLEPKVGYPATITGYEKLCWVLKHWFPYRVDGPVRFTDQGIPSDFRTDLRVVSVGDLMFMGRDYDLGAFLPEWRSRYGDAFRIGNLESPVALSHPPSSPRSFLRFNGSERFWEQIRAMGFHALSVANNHSFDMGEEGLRETCERLEREGILPVGASFVRESVTRHAGHRIGCLAYTFGTNREPENDAVERFPFHRSDAASRKAEIVASIRALGERCDLVILALHWGYECETSPDPDVRRLARELVEAGADLLLGSHPHVVQPVERIARAERGDALVLYSQGNFLTRAVHHLMRTGHVFDIRIRFENGALRMAYAVQRVVTSRGARKTRFA